MQLVRAVDAAEELGDAVDDLVHAVVHAGRAPGTTALPVFELVRLLAGGERRLGELATRRGVGQPVVSRQVAELQDRGLVTRRPDPADARAVLVRLTPAGGALRDEVARVRRRWLHDALGRQPVEDVRAAVRVVRALTAELDRRIPATPAPALPEGPA